MHKPWIRDLPRYVPGVAPKVGEEGKLSSNESFPAPPDRVLRAVLDAARRLNRYPDPLASGLREVLAGKMGVSEDAILVGNGSDELIYLLAMAYLGPGSKVVVADPPYLMHEIASRALGAEVVRVPLDDYRHDLDAMAEVEADVAFIPNPHNPTGTAVPLAEIEHFLDTSGAELVIVDEAYVDFADDPQGMSSLRLIKATGRVVVLRTLSKLYGLAGARVGYMMAPPEIVETLRKIRAPFSVNALAQAAAEAVLSDEGYAEKTRLLVRENRDRIGAAFEQAGYRVVPSQSNFVLVRASDERALLQKLESVGIVARPGSVLSIAGHVRVSAAPLKVIERLEEALSV
jgi:histidinol-phosphate aminotransferase